MGAGGDKNFSQYLESLGLGEKEDVARATPKAKVLTAEEAIKKAEEILAMARKKGKGA